jgi:hypothetical protein
LFRYVSTLNNPVHFPIFRIFNLIPKSMNQVTLTAWIGDEQRGAGMTNAYG